jgi:hypothetical protein
MPRCRIHLDYDRYVDEAERLVTVRGLSIEHPLVKRAMARARVATGMMRSSGHAFGNACPDETPEEADARKRRP